MIGEPVPGSSSSKGISPKAPSGTTIRWEALGRPSAGTPPSRRAPIVAAGPFQPSVVPADASFSSDEISARSGTTAASETMPAASRVAQSTAERRGPTQYSRRTAPAGSRPWTAASVGCAALPLGTFSAVETGQGRLPAVVGLFGEREGVGERRDRDREVGQVERLDDADVREHADPRLLVLVASQELLGGPVSLQRLGRVAQATIEIPEIRSQARLLARSQHLG